MKVVLEIIIVIKSSCYSSNLTTNHVKTLLGTNLKKFLPSSQKPISQGTTYPHNLGLGLVVWRPSGGLATPQKYDFQHMPIDGVRIHFLNWNSWIQYIYICVLCRLFWIYDKYIANYIRNHNNNGIIYIYIPDSRIWI